MDNDTTDYGGWLEALEKRAIENGEDRVNNICRKAIGRAARRLIETESKLDAAQKRIAELEAPLLKCSFDDCDNTVRRPICDDCDFLLRMED